MKKTIAREPELMFGALSDNDILFGAHSEEYKEYD
jgi:hypothetical protein